MSAASKIEWTDATWNPVRGCVKVSPGCKHCYAATLAERFRGVRGHPYEFGFDLRLIPEKLDEPLKWKKPKRVFVNSMSDLFQPGVPDSYIRKICDVMQQAPWHTFQVLTKRHDRMVELLSTLLKDAANASHIWWGVSAEDIKYGLPRIAALRNSIARIKFVSAEPLLENLLGVRFSNIDWVIVGGESGQGARPMRLEWVENVQRACRRDGAAFFFKQWGGVQKSKHGRILHGRTYDEMPNLRDLQVDELVSA